jgi:hypothetical protein
MSEATSKINDADYIGTGTKEKCKRQDCHGFILVNKRGDRWCSSTTCDYMIFNGKQTVIPKDYSAEDHNRRR